MRVRTRARSSRCRALCVAVAAVAPVLAFNRPSGAINIVLNFDAANSINPAGDAGAANLISLMQYVETYYQGIFEDSHTLTLTYRYANAGEFSNAGTLADHTLTAEGGSPWRETAGSIRIDNSVTWYYDATPESSSEYDMQQTLWRDLSAANQAAFFNVASGTVPATFEAGYEGTALTTAPSAARNNTDLLSVLLHEVGHALGMSSGNNATVTQTGDGDYDFNPAFVNGVNFGAQVPSGNIAHLAGTDMLLFPSIGTGIRRLPSHADLFSMASGDSFSLVDAPRREFYGGTNWNNAADWSGNQVPASNDDAYVRNPGSIVSVGLTADGFAANLFVSEAAWVSTNANKLDVAGTTTIEGLETGSTSRVRVQTGGEFETNSLTVRANGYLNPLGGLVDVIGSATVDVDGIVGGYGTVQVAGNLNNNGTIRGTSSTDALVFTTAGAGVWDLDGTSGNGAVEAISGDVTFTGSLNDAFDGTMTVSSGRTLTFNTAWEQAAGGVLAMNGLSDTATLGGTTATIRGAVNVSGTAMINAPTSFQSTAAVAVAAGANLTLNNTSTLSGGSYTGAGTLVQGSDITVATDTTIAVTTFDWGNSTLFETNTLTVSSGADLTINSTGSGSGDNQYRGGIILNSGILNVNFASGWSLPASISSPIFTPGGSLTFDDSGTNPTVNGVPLTVGGTVTANTGTGTINADVTFNASATVTANAGADLNLNGTTTFNGGTYTGAGAISQGGDMVVAASTTIGTTTFDWGNSVLLIVDGLNTLTVNAGQTLTVNSTGTGTAGNDYRGTIQLNSGVLAVNMAGGWALPASTIFPTTSAGGVLNMNNTGGGTPAVTGQPLTVGGTINVTGAGVISPAVTFNGGNVNVTNASDTLTLNGATTYSGGSYAGAGTIVQTGAATVAANTTLSVGTYNWDGGPGLTSTTLNPGVTFTLNVGRIDDSAPASDGHDGTINVNGAILAVNTTDPWRLDGTMNLNVSGGTYPTVNGSPILVYGTVNADGNASTINANVDFQSTAAVTVTDAGDMLGLSGAITYRGGSYTGAGTIRQHGPATVAANTTIGVTTFDWDGGTSGAGVTNVMPGVTFTINSNVIDQFGGAYDGTLTVDSGVLAVNTAAAWGLDAAGTMNLKNTSGVPLVQGAGIIASGKINSTGTSKILAAVDFQPTANVQVPNAGDGIELVAATVYRGGTYAGLGTLQQTGAATVMNNTTVNVGTFDMDGGSEAGAATTVNAGVTLTVNSSLIESTGGDGFDGTLTANSATVAINTASAWAMEGTLNLHKTAAAMPTLNGSQMVLAGTLNSSGGAQTNAKVHFVAGAAANVSLASTNVRFDGAVSSNAGATLTKGGNGRLVIGGLQTHGAGAKYQVNAGELQLNTDAGSVVTAPLSVAVASGATATFVSTQHLADLLVDNNADVTLTAGGAKVLYTKGLSILGTGALDLANNDMVHDYAGATPLPAMAGWIAAGYAGGAWTGNGITSSSAAVDPDKVRGLGYTEASALGITLFSGQPVDATSVLVKFTYYGDSNLDGMVDGDDYLRIDRGMAMGLSGWVNGDYDYNGAVTGTDYLLIDKAYVKQTGVLSPEMLADREARFGSEYAAALVSAVPEPGAGLSVAVLGAGALAGRRRRRAQAS